MDPSDVSPAAPAVIRTERVQAIAERLRARAGDPAALRGLDCPACGVLGGSWSDEDPDGARAAAAESLRPFAKPERRWSIRECRACGALFAQTASGPPAAEDLFDVTVHLERISIDRAVEMLPIESAYAQQERTVEQALALVLGGACYLNNFSRVQKSRMGEERFIFRDGDVILDAWHVQATGMLGNVARYPLDEFKSALPELFPGDAVDARFVGPIEQMPAVVRQDAPRRRRLGEDLSAALAEGTQWVHLATYAPPTPRRTGPRRRKKHSVRRESVARAAGATSESYLYRGPIAGWLYVSCKAGVITGVKVDAATVATRRLDDVLREDPTVATKPVPPKPLARLRQIEAGLVDALARLEAGESCAHPLGLLALVGGRFVVADLAGDVVQNLVELDRTRALDHLASELAGRRAVTFAPLSPADRQRVAAVLDPDERWQLFLAGRLVVGGGPTTDMQWTLACENGAYRFDGSSGSEVMAEARARDIVREKRYGWLRLA